MKIENIAVGNMEAALRGMRNPMNSWAKSTPEADIELGRKLSAAGPVHGKFLRMITITCDITAPLYWWKEFDTYKVGTVANSCSTMHTLMSKPFEIRDFELTNIYLTFSKIKGVVDTLNDLRNCFIDCRQKGLKTDEEAYWRTVISMLPSGYLQRRTVLLNYEVMRRIVIDRTGHKLQEWKIFIDSMKEELPYWGEFILGIKPLSAKSGSDSECETTFEKDISNEKRGYEYKEVLNTKPIKWDAVMAACLTGMADEGTKIINEFADSLKTNISLENAEPSENDETENDPIKPSHYKDHCSIECIDAMILACGADAVYAFCICNAYKYLWRHKYKNGADDLDKARWYIRTAQLLAADYPDSVEYEECGEDLSRMIDKYHSKLDKI